MTARSPYQRPLAGLYGERGSDLLREQSFSFRNGLYQPVREESLLLRDTTLGDVSITKHGFAPKAPNDATKFLDGTGAFSVPAGGGLSTEDDYAYDRLDLNWFSRQGLLPSTKIKLKFKDFPAFDGISAGADSYNMSRCRLSASAYGRWALGAAYTKVLLVFGFIRATSSNASLWMSNTHTSNTPQDGDLFANNSVGSTLYKLTSFTQADSNSEFFMGVTTTSYQAGMAMYYDCTAHRVICFYMVAPGTWWPVMDTTSATNIALTQIQHVGVNCGATGLFGTPIAIYGQ
jgi:hypothetical protein